MNNSQIIDLLATEWKAPLSRSHKTTKIQIITYSNLYIGIIKPSHKLKIKYIIKTPILGAQIGPCWQFYMTSAINAFSFILYLGEFL